MTAVTQFLKPQDRVAAGSSALYSGQLVDDSGVGVLPNTLTLSIIDSVSKAVINAANQANILNTGRGSVDSSGNVTITLSPSDTTMNVASDTYEQRSLVLDFTYGQTSKTGRHQVDFAIVSLIGA